MPIDYGNGLIYPDAWAQGPPDPPDTVSCDQCGEDRLAVPGEPCPHCGDTAERDE